ncbi:DEAD-box ATP-dependent RNA helicase 53-like [Aristolochia californica]|uniref:DEAD-box ATP-dependent RNA helicase 53-like n=1 Tax=Aristolochia californica TaxID=171875 RepID=UPI0035DD2B5A
MASLLSTPLPSSAFLQRSHNTDSFSSHFCSFSSISIPVSRKSKLFLYRKPISAYATAVEYELPSRTNGFNASDNLDIAKLGISEEIVSALSRRGITELFPIQRAVLEPAMEGRDMIGRAITGSGKTLAFGIPILDKIMRHRKPQRQKRIPSALVLAPTRELARQVEKEFKESAPNLSSVCLYGGIPISNQCRMLGYGIDIAVGTPGRIIDLVERGALDLSEVKFAVLDEADQMLAVGFQEDVECILNYLPAKKQCLLFSATMPSWVNDLSRKYLRNPLIIDLVGDSDQKLADGISLYSVSSTASGKQNSLLSLISKFGQGGKSIVFTRTKKDAEALSLAVGTILRSRALHGNMQQFKRDKTLSDFRSGRFNVLIATDVAARGLDIPNVDLVVHFEMPNTSEIFVHRSGRTGRAGKKGTAVLMFTEAQRRGVRTIERDLGCKFEELPKFTDKGGNKARSMDFEEKQSYNDELFSNWPVANYEQSRHKSNGYANRIRDSNANGFSGGRQNKMGRAHVNNYDDELGDNYSTEYAEYGSKSSRSSVMQTGQRFNQNGKPSSFRFKEGGRRTSLHLNDNHNKFGRNYQTKDVSRYAATNPGKGSRSGFAKYGLDRGSLSHHGRFGNELENSQGKARQNDFKQILDALRDD